MSCPAGGQESKGEKREESVRAEGEDWEQVGRKKGERWVAERQK